MEVCKSSAHALEVSLTRSVGALIGGAMLTRTLGYPSQAAFRQALARGRVQVPVFEIEGRRGKFALARDVAVWLSQQSMATPRPRHAVREEGFMS